MKDIGNTRQTERHGGQSKDDFSSRERTHTEGPDRFEGRGLDGGPDHPHINWYHD